MGVDRGLAAFEWSADDDVDATDSGGWWRFMPVLGHRIDIDTVQADLASMDLSERRRCYANQWLDEVDAEGWRIIPRDLWEQTGL